MTAELKTKFLDATERVKDSLPPLEVVSHSEAGNIIGRYVAAIEGNFVPWMAAAALYARSPQGEYAAKENLDCEIRENHQGMLRRFMNKAGVLPKIDHYHAVDRAVSSMRDSIGQGSGLVTLTVMATLESTSAGFIPYLAELAQKRGSTDFRYTDIHGEADIKHADQFIWAVGHEMKYFEDAERTVDSTIETTCNFLEVIFKPVG